jgi:hypothetical protein
LEVVAQMLVEWVVQVEWAEWAEQVRPRVVLVEMAIPEKLARAVAALSAM